MDWRKRILSLKTLNVSFRHPLFERFVFIRLGQLH